MTRSNQFSFISLFSGCGGFDIGFINAGFEPVAAFDIWPLAVRNYKKNVANDAQVYDLSAGKIPTDVTCDVVLAGSPCQGFSTVGKRNFDDPRNQLLHAAVEIAITAKPRVMVFENVPGVVQGSHKEYWDKALERLEQAEYMTSTLVLDARDFGVAQSRKRVFLIAWQANVSLHPSIEKEGAPPLSTVLSGLEPCANHEPRTFALGSSDYLLANKIMPGQKLCDVRGGGASVHTWEVPEVFGATTDSEREVLIAVMKLRRQIRKRAFGDADPVSARDIYCFLRRRVMPDVKSLVAKGYLRKIANNFDLRHTFNGKYRRAAPDGHSFTVDTRFGDPKCFLHPTEMRGFTVREAARIQSFPDSYIFDGPERDQFKMIGNAVPPKVGFAIAKLVKEALSKGACGRAA